MFLLISLILTILPTPTDISKVEWLGPTEHEFGDLQQGVPVSTAFRFRNTSDVPIFIDNVRTTCGCTSPDWSDTVVEPGAEDSIQVEFDAKKLGYFHKKITVYFSGQRRAEKLYISGYVE